MEEESKLFFTNVFILTHFHRKKIFWSFKINNKEFHNFEYFEKNNFSNMRNGRNVYLVLLYRFTDNISIKNLVRFSTFKSNLKKLKTMNFHTSEFMFQISKSTLNIKNFDTPTDSIAQKMKLSSLFHYCAIIQ